MSAPAIHIRARTPPLQHSPDQEVHHAGHHRGLGSRRWNQLDQHETSGWDASTGSVQARNLQRLSKTRFVKEGEKSRPWTGNWVEPEEDSLPKTEESGEDDPESDALDHEALQPLQPTVAPADFTQTSDTMASFYAQLAATLKAPSVVSATSRSTPSNATPASVPGGMRPRSVIQKSRSEGKSKSRASTTDWFSNRPRLPTGSARLGAGEGSASKFGSDEPREQGSASVPGTLAPCPTCSTPLPYPCPPEVIRSHLSSIAHRLALPHLPPTPSSSTTTSTKTGEQSHKLKLHLDEANRGYKLLSEMGWKEGMGVGRSEWEWQEGERERERNRVLQEAAKRRQEAEDRRTIKLEADAERKALVGDVLVISSDEGEVEDEDDFEALALLDSVAGDGIDDVFHLPPPSSLQEPGNQSGAIECGVEQQDGQAPSTAQRPEPRLVPISISQKHDRAGLGRKLLPSSSSSSALAGGKKRKGGTGGAEALFTLRKRERESRDRQDREERMAIRDTLR